MTNDEIRQEYFMWLVDSVRVKEINNDRYNLLFNILDDVEFRWNIEKDSNRAADGIDLRSTFAYEKGYDYLDIRPALMRNCSVLEMMVGLARRMENGVLSDSEKGDRTGVWFWTMLKNLGLDGYSDYVPYQEELILEILDEWLDGKYDENGPHCLFNLRGYHAQMPTFIRKSQYFDENWSKIEIWWQMQFWANLMEID